MNERKEDTPNDNKIQTEYEEWCEAGCQKAADIIDGLKIDAITVENCSKLSCYNYKSNK